jgi:hypothetical protein
MMSTIRSIIAKAMQAQPILKAKRYMREDKYPNGYNKTRECARRMRQLGYA